MRHRNHPGPHPGQSSRTLGGQTAAAVAFRHGGRCGGASGWAL